MEKSIWQISNVRNIAQNSPFTIKKYFPKKLDFIFRIKILPAMTHNYGSGTKMLVYVPFSRQTQVVQQ
jgi:hypothetical protein